MPAKPVSHLAIGILLYCIVAAIHAQTPAFGSQAFDRGTTAFQGEEYSKALAYFLSARDDGIQAPQLGYDLGVTYYHLGRYDEARHEFQALTGIPSIAALSHYNLGLIALKQNDPARARMQFNAAYSGTHEPALQALAAAALDALGSPPSKNQKLTVFANAGTGYNSNVALTSESTALTPSQQGSDVYSLLAGAIAQLSGDSHQGWQAVGTFYRVDYPSVSQYNQSYLHVGSQYRWGSGDWSHMFGFYAGDVALGGSHFETLATASADSRWAYSTSSSLHAFYRYTRVKGSSSYDYLTGWHQSVGIEDTLQISHIDLTLGYSLDFNERNNYNTPTQFLSASPTVNGLYAILNWHLNDATTLYFENDYQYSHYEGADLVSPGDSITSVVRDDTWWSSTLGMSYAFSDQWALRLDCSFTDNQSNIQQYSYHNNLVMASFEYIYSH